ncbi:MAG TPA: GNAT family N-acetyltransferase [Nocardioides sp.]|nr:GNAT family N-acetyltransferase [Nocardioides sp.]
MDWAERVVAASGFVWVPETAVRTETREFLLVRFPDHFDHHLVLATFRPEREPEEVVDDVLARAREFEEPELVWWVKLGAPPGMDELVQARGGVLDETLDVLALDLAPGLPDLGDHAVTLRWTTDEATLRHAYEVLKVVFGGAVPPEHRLRVESEQVRRDVERGRGGGVVAYLGDEPVGTGGVTVADDVARLWSGSVLEEHRGRGAYRAMLAARLDYALRNGATMALVKGRVETSGPILRRAGFVAHGQERSYRVPL